MRRITYAALVASIAALAAGVIAWQRDCDQGTNCAYGPPALAIALRALAVFGAVLAAVILVRLALRAGPRPPVSAIVLSLAVGLLAATPVTVYWTDDCHNGHAARTPLITAPLVSANDPEHASTAYQDISTLIGCG